MDIGTVIVSALRGVSKVLLIALGGAVLSWRGILDLPTSRGISKVTYNFTFPCLMFVSILTVIDADNFVVIGIIITCAICHFLILLSFGFLLRKFARVPAHFLNGVVVTTTFGNVGDMVLAMVLGVGGSPPFGEGATTRGLAYVMVYAVIFSVFQFTLGDMMIASEMRRNLDYKKLAEDLELDQNADENVTDERAESMALHQGDPERDIPLTPQEGKLLREREKMKSLHKFTSVDVLLENHQPVEAKPSCLEWAFARLGCHVILPHRLKVFLGFLWKLCTPPNASILVGIIVGLIPAVKHLFYHPGESPPLGFLYETLQLVGGATVPLGIMNVGGALAKFSLKSSKVPLRLNLLICFIKLAVMPVIGIGCYYLLTFQAFVLPADDKMLIFVLMTQCCVPSAQFLVSLYQIHGGDGHEVAGVMLVQYLLTIVTMSVYVTAILYILQ